MKAYQFALIEYGLKEIVGSKHNAKIVQFFKDIGHKWVQDDETAWCAAFANWCLKQQGLPHTGKLNARSFLDYGQATKTPILGDLVVFWRISKHSAFGHVGFYINETETGINVLGGNQSNQVNIQTFPKSQLLGYRKTPLL